MSYYVDVDIAGDPTNEEAVASLRCELRDRRISVKVLELEGPAGGNPLVRLRADGPNRLKAWLVRNEYDLNVHDIINTREARFVAVDR